VLHGFVSFKSQRFEGGGMRYLRFGRWLADMLALSGQQSGSQTGSQTNLTGIGAVYFEEVRRHLGVDAAHVYGGLLATLYSRWSQPKQDREEKLKTGKSNCHHPPGSSNCRPPTRTRQR